MTKYSNRMTAQSESTVAAALDDDVHEIVKVNLELTLKSHDIQHDRVNRVTIEFTPAETGVYAAWTAEVDE